MSSFGGAVGMLQRIAAAKAAPPDYERCEMCGEPIGDEHGHVVALANRSLMCTCRGCTLLFAYESAQLHYVAVPDRYLHFPELELSPGLWDDLQIPVGLVFMFDNSTLGRTVAFYPGPAGATESELPLGAWDDVVSTYPVLGIARPDVEALLLRAPARDRGEIECFLVPIDRCYELIGRLRQGWRGFDGGHEARAYVSDFFADITRRARPAPPPDPDPGPA